MNTLHLPFAEAVYVPGDGRDGLEAAHQGRVPVRLRLTSNQSNEIDFSKCFISPPPCVVVQPLFF